MYLSSKKQLIAELYFIDKLFVLRYYALATNKNAQGLIGTNKDTRELERFKGYKDMRTTEAIETCVGYIGHKGNKDMRGLQRLQRLRRRIELNIHAKFN